MLQFLVCSDIHTYADNIRLAIRKTDRVDAVLIAGDLETEEDAVLTAVGSIPCYMVSGNNDYYLNTDYPEELLIDVIGKNDPGRDGPAIGKVTELTYDSVPDTGSGQASRKESFLSSFLKFFTPEKEELPKGLSYPQHTFRRPANITHRILMTHGKEYNVPDIALLARRAGIWDADLVIFGHTHQFQDTTFRRGQVRLINPGCLVGDPRASVRVFGNYEICSYALLRIGDRGEIDVEHIYL
jgi:predicted phosphodiesterase